MKTLLILVKPLVKEELRGFVDKQLSSKSYSDFKARVLALKTEDAVSAFEGYIRSLVDKF